MGFFSNIFNPQPAPAVVIRNVVGEPLAEISGRDLVRANLKGLNLAHAELSKCSLFGANLEGANLFGARLDGADFSQACLRNCDISYTSAVSTKFHKADARGLLADCAVVTGPTDDRGVPCEFTDAVIDETTAVYHCVVRREHEPYAPKSRPKTIWPRQHKKRCESFVTMSPAEDRFAQIAEKAERDRDRELDAQARRDNP